jgi:hypothetical protein
MSETTTLEQAVHHFFDILNRTEESDSGHIFHPVTINCCRVMWMQDLEDTLTTMAELSGSELKKNEH